MNKIKQLALKYLGHTNQELTESFDSLLNECVKEVIEIAQLKVYWQRYSLEHPLRVEELDILISSESLESNLENCKECIVIASTLGVQIDKKIKYYSSYNMSKGIVFDAVASAYLEVGCDEYEDKYLPENRSYRYAPGYSDIPLSLNRLFATRMNLYKHLGVSIDQNDLFIPMKTMLGIIGIGEVEKTKSCKGCKQLNDCEFIRRNQTCY